MSLCFSQTAGTVVATAYLKPPRPPHPSGWNAPLKLLQGASIVAGAILRHGRPREVLLAGWGGMGDDLLYTAIARELHARTGRKLWVLSRHPKLFQNHPAVSAVIDPRGSCLYWIERTDIRVLCENYGGVLDRQRPPALRHQIALIASAMGLHGTIRLRPSLYLQPAERAQGRLGPRQICIQSSVLAARFPSPNKQWPVERMAAVAATLAAQNHTVVQIGDQRDPLLPGVIDRRGQPDLRQVAAWLSASDAFIGMEGFLSHLARAVDCRSVIIYGGYTAPDETGYTCNENLFTPVPCAPCWEPVHCDHNRQCLSAIQPAHVLDAVNRVLSRAGQPLVVTAVELP